MIIVKVETDEDSAGVLDVEIIPETNYVTYHNEALIDTIGKKKKDWEKFICTRDVIGNRNHIIIKGDLEEDFRRTSRGLNILHPEFYFLTLLKERLEERRGGVSGGLLIGKRPDNAHFLMSVRRSFADVIENLNKESDNLSAEMTLRALGTLAGEEQTGAPQGITMIDSLIEKVGFSPREYRIVDGSGVSRYNVVTTELTLALLKYLYTKGGDDYSLFYHSLPISGKDGTLERRMRKTKAEGKVHAKTGTLSGVSTLSGYVESAGGDTIAFSIFIQHHVSRTKLARKYQDRLCEILAGIE
jgi:D-alanyl-D-alanine carboxypeptidase/D-alanyl-D-alanine-endopeptidase (penicillin-binding protein 4)